MSSALKPMFVMYEPFEGIRKMVWTEVSCDHMLERLPDGALLHSVHEHEDKNDNTRGGIRLIHQLDENDLAKEIAQYALIFRACEKIIKQASR